jgi:hypothetical protein
MLDAHLAGRNHHLKVNATPCPAYRVKKALVCHGTLLAGPFRAPGSQCRDLGGQLVLKTREQLSHVAIKHGSGWVGGSESLDNQPLDNVLQTLGMTGSPTYLDKPGTAVPGRHGLISCRQHTSCLRSACPSSYLCFLAKERVRCWLCCWSTPCQCSVRVCNIAPPLTVILQAHTHKQAWGA